jgi:hypothetical protein
MSDLEMLDVAVRYVYENRAWLTNEQIEMYIDADSLIEGMNIEEVKAVRERLKQQLRVVRKKYEEMLAAPPIYPPAPTPPLPASPPPEREDCAMCTDQWNCGCYMPNNDLNELNERINTQDNDLWTDCNLGRMGLNCRNYIDEPQKEEQPSFITKDENYIDLTCDADGCTYGCGAKCGAEEEEDYSDMPPLLPLSSQVNRWPPITHQRTEIVGAQATPRGWLNPEEDTEDEEPVPRPSVPLPPQQLRTLSGYRHPELARMTTFNTEEQPQQAPKVKPLFPYNHPVWPSPRAKAVVQWLIRTGRTSKMTMRETLGEPISALTHEVCMRYLAAYYGLSHEQLLETSVFKLHNTPAMRSNGLLCGCGLCRSSRSLCSYEAY